MCAALVMAVERRRQSYWEGGELIEDSHSFGRGSSDSRARLSAEIEAHAHIIVRRLP